MSYKLYLKLPGLPKPMNRLLRRHWALVKKEKDHWHEMVALSLVGKKPPGPLSKVKLRIVRHSSRAPDFDGCVSAAKFLIDGLVISKVIINDTMEVVGSPAYEWQKGKQGEGFMEVFLEEIT